MKNREDASWRRIELAIGVFLSLALVVFHVVRLFHAGPLWRDEISSLTLATQPTWSGFWATLRFDPFPAMFFLLLRGWHGMVGESDFALRLLGTSIGVAVIAAFWVAARLTHRRPPLVTLLLIGFCPSLIIWGDTLRAYGVGVFWIVVSFGCFWRLLESPGRRTMSYATLTAVMSVQAAFTNSLLIFALAAGVSGIALVRHRWASAWMAVLAGGIAALSLLPYVPTLLQTRQWSALNQAEVTIRTHLAVIFQAIDGDGGGSIYLWLLAAAIALALCLFGLRPRAEMETAELTPKRDLPLFALLVLVIGSAATLLFFWQVGWNSNVWYFLPALSLVAVALDAITASLGFSRVFVIAKNVVVVVIMGLLMPAIWNALQARASNLDLVAQLISRRAQPGDTVVLYPFADGITFQRYFKGSTEWTTIPPVKDHALHNWGDVLAAVEQPQAMAPVLARINQSLHDGGRVWVVSSLPLNPVPGPPSRTRPDKSGNRSLLAAYLIYWSSQLVYDLNTHARRIDQIRLPPQEPISAYEEASVFLATAQRE